MIPTTLSDMLSAPTAEPAEEQLQWMMLTWDLAATTGRANQYVRYFMTASSSLVTTDRRTPKHFSRDTPLTGTVDQTALEDSQALEGALTHTDALLERGYAMVCRPLAMDCFDFSHTAVIDGEPLRNAGQLLDQMFRKTEIGVDVLACLNWVRSEARRTHLAPDWRETTGYTDAAALWSGR